MPPETELIKQQMGQTRASLTEKMEALESKVFGTVHGTTDTVSHTVQDVSSTVTQTVREVGAAVCETSRDVRATLQEAMGSVRDTLDLTRQAQQHPWLLLGGSVVVGYVGGRVLDGLERGHLPSLPSVPVRPEQLLPSDAEVRERLETQPPARRGGLSVLNTLLETFAPELDKLKRAAVSLALAAVRDKLSESVPPAVRDNFTELMDRVSVKLGGEPPPPGAVFGRGEDEHDGNGSHMARSMGQGGY